MKGEVCEESCDAKSSKCPKKAGAGAAFKGRVRDGPLRWVPFFFPFPLSLVPFPFSLSIFFLLGMMFE